MGGARAAGQEVSLQPPFLRNRPAL
jgi:hypothetical protein